MRAAVPGDIDDEARIFARYLLSAVPPADVLPRYRDAVSRLLPGPDDPRDRSLVGFVLRHPWAVAYLDSAAALLAPKSRLRARLLIMAALCETTPEGAVEFLPREPGRAAVLARLPVIGLVAAWRTIVGFVLYAAAVAGA
jgi:hypothetical protein